MTELTSEKVYSYKGLRRIGIIISQIGGVFGIVFFSTFGLGLFILALVSNVSTPHRDFLNNPLSTVICVALWSIGISWFCGSLLMNYAPTIWVKEDGIAISYYIFFRIFIPWNEIVDVIDQKLFFIERTLIIAKRISLYHRIASWFYFHFREPCFVIGNDIEDKEKLVALIRSKALLHSRYYKTYI